MVRTPTPLQKLLHPVIEEKKLEVFVKRDDLIHPEIMGNKWRKLKYNLKAAQNLGKRQLVTLGGAYSNHIAATAAAGREYGFDTVGIIRGEELAPESNQTLVQARNNGMKLLFISRELFREVKKNDDYWMENFPDAYFLAEGGTNDMAIKGVAEVMDEITIDFDWIITPVGTGGTYCGLLSKTKAHQKVLGISALKGDFMKKEINDLIHRFNIQNKEIHLDTTSHHGGYAKTSFELIDFIGWFKETFSILLDPIYTGKAFFAVWKMITSDQFEINSRLIILHTGGLQGITDRLLKK